MLGRGRRLFSDRVAARELALVSTKATPTGVLIDTCRRREGPHAERRGRGQPVGPRRGKKGRAWGVDAGKKIAERKRHLVVDTPGPILAVAVHAANVHDSVGARPVLAQLE